MAKLTSMRGTLSSLMSVSSGENAALPARGRSPLFEPMALNEE